MAFRFERTSRAGAVVSLLLLGFCALALTSCLARIAKPVGYHQGGDATRLRVSQNFEFSRVGGLAKVKATYSVPAGVYVACAADQEGTYYLAPDRRIGLKTFYQDQFPGGIYRSNSGTPQYRLFAGGPAGGTEMAALTVGPYPDRSIEIPAEFEKFISFVHP
jgi:hypothetical protein